MTVFDGRAGLLRGGLTEAEADLVGRLLAVGVPVIAVGPGDQPRQKWKHVAGPGDCRLDRYRPGDALYAIGGHGIDVVDVDPANGGSLEALGVEFKAWGVGRTPSGGTHHLVPSCGLGKISPLDGPGGHVGDYCGGREDLTSRLGWYLPGSKRTKYPAGGYVVEQAWDVEGCVAAAPQEALVEALRGAGGARGRAEWVEAPWVPGEATAAEQARALGVAQWKARQLAAREPGGNRTTLLWAGLQLLYRFVLAGALDRDEAEDLMREAVEAQAEGARSHDDTWDEQARRAWLAAVEAGPLRPVVEGESDFVDEVDEGGGGGEGCATCDLLGADCGGHVDLLADWTLDDVGNAGRVLARLGGRVVFNLTMGKWQAWDGQVWSLSAGDLVVERAMQEVGLDMLAAATGKAQRAFAVKSRSDSAIRAAVRQARAMPGVWARNEDFDQRPDLLACGGGTLELAMDGAVQVRGHRAEDRLTGAVPWRYDPDATSAAWQDLLETVQPKQESRDGLQAAAGYTLYGQNYAKVFLTCLGATNSGKSTFINTLGEVLGSLRVPFRAADVLKRTGSSHQTSLLDALAARMATCSEFSAEQAIHADATKELTAGSDPVPGRRAYAKQSESLVPRCTPWIGTNELPNISGMDAAMQMRFKTIPFEQVPDEAWWSAWYARRDAEGERFWVAVLAWMAEGWPKWIAGDFAAACAGVWAEAAVQTGERFGWAREFWDATYTQVLEGEAPEGAVVRGVESWMAFERWAEDAGREDLEGLTQRDLGAALTRAGLPARNGRVAGLQVRGRHGWRVRTLAERMVLRESE